VCIVELKRSAAIWRENRRVILRHQPPPTRSARDVAELISYEMHEADGIVLPVDGSSARLGLGAWRRGAKQTARC